jgi:seryl-tRNA synthetase
MNVPVKPVQSPEAFLNALFDESILIRTGVDGLYGRAGVFEEVIDGFEAAVTRIAVGDRATRIHFPPGMPRKNLEKAGYLKSFPQLAGCVHSFMGDTADHAKLVGMIEQGQDWTEMQDVTEVALTPAACYPLYPTVAAEGPVPDGGRLFDLKSYCFRHEPSKDPGRMQLFRMREFVRIGTADEVTAFRATWLERGEKLIGSLGLPCVIDLANDPFFGRTGKVMASSQRDQGLKFELLIPVASDETPTACLSFNYHQNHFGSLWGMQLANGDVAHSACVGFGLERTALALFRHHGTAVDRWPDEVRRVLWG